VQRARESANQASCANNLRQLGLALTHYHDANGSLPPGVSATKEWDTTTMSWGAFVVPYLEQETLAKEIRDAVPQIRKGNLPAFLFGTVIPAFGCPSDALTKSPQVFPPGSPSMVAYSSYLGVEGISMYQENGCLYQDSEVRWTDITDGTSNTLLVGERPAAAKNPCWSVWYMGLFGQTASWPTGSGNKMESATSCSSVLGVREVMVSPYRGCKREPSHFGPGRLANICDFFHFWSWHGGGANFLFADGRVRFLSYSADNILPALATRAGGEVAGD
jgi:prepilin-type processing-associated H-X9-DG protein